MSLIVPGKYELSYNQEYLIAKLYSIDVYQGIFWAFWLSIGFALVIYYYSGNKRKQEDKERSVESRQLAIECFKEFNEVCRMIWEDKTVFKRPQSLIEQMYYERIAQLLVLIGRNRQLMLEKYRYLIPDYEYYRTEIARFEKEKRSNPLNLLE